MSENLENLWRKVKDLKHYAFRFTDNSNVHGLINDLIEEIEVAMADSDYEDDDYHGYEDDDDNNVVNLMMTDD